MQYGGLFSDLFKALQLLILSSMPLPLTEFPKSAIFGETRVRDFSFLTMCL